MKQIRAILLTCLTAGAVFVLWQNRENALERARSASAEARGIHAAQKAGTGCMEVSPATGRVLYADPQACAVFGYNPGELDDKRLASLMPAWLGAFHDQHVHDALTRAKSDPTAPRIVVVQCDALDKSGGLVRVITRAFLDPEENTMFAYVNKAAACIWKNVDPMGPNKPVIP